MTPFRNESGLHFTDISSEAERVYTFPNGKTYRIEKPRFLNVSDSGGHRIFDGEWSHYIKPAEGWAIKWRVADGEPHFVA